MKEIILWDIVFEVDGNLYTTNADFDHSFFCSIVTMEDLELLTSNRIAEILGEEE